MRNFEVGDWVYAHDWCYGQVIRIEDGIALIQYYAGGTSIEGGYHYCSFMIDDLRKAEAPTYEREEN